MKTPSTSGSRGPGIRLSPERRQEILDAYQAWDPSAESSDDLAKRLNTSKTTLYTLVRSAGLSMRGTTQTREETYGQAEHMARIALQTLLERLEELSRLSADLQAENDGLKEQLATTQKALRAAKRA